MNLLAIDCACSVLSVAVMNGEKICHAQTDAEMNHSRLVMEMIDGQMKEAGLRPKDLNGVLCMGGPGSFTGLRIGFSIAKGLALSLSVPFAPVGTLDCVAYPFRDHPLTLAAVPARKNAFFYAVFRGTERVKPDEDAEIAQIAREIELLTENGENLTLTGAGSGELYNALPERPKSRILPEIEKRGYARELIAIAKNLKILDNDTTAFLGSGPEYIRKADAELNLLGNGGSRKWAT